MVDLFKPLYFLNLLLLWGLLLAGQYYLSLPKRHELKKLAYEITLLKSQPRPITQRIQAIKKSSSSNPTLNLFLQSEVTQQHIILRGFEQQINLFNLSFDASYLELLHFFEKSRLFWPNSLFCEKISITKLNNIGLLRIEIYCRKNHD